MRRLNVPLILDALFAALCAFLLFFTAVRYYTKNLFLALGLGLAAFALFGCLCFLYIGRKQDKKLLLARNLKQKKLLALHLSLSPDSAVLKLFKAALGEGSAIRGGRIFTEKSVYFFFFRMQPLSEDDVAQAIKYKCDREKIIYCNYLSPESRALAQSFYIKCLQIDEVYAQLEENGLLPEKYLCEEQTRPKLRERIKASFNRRLCAPLFWSGAALLALSYFTYFPIYYIVSGGIMLVLSAVALVFR